MSLSGAVLSSKKADADASTVALNQLNSLMPLATSLAEQSNNPQVEWKVRELQELLASQLHQSVDGVPAALKIADEKTLPLAKRPHSSPRGRFVEWAHTLGATGEGCELDYSVQHLYASLANDTADAVLKESGSDFPRQSLQEASWKALVFAIREFDPACEKPFEEHARLVITGCLHALISAKWPEENEKKFGASTAMYIAALGYRGARGTGSRRGIKPSSEEEERFESWATSQGIAGNSHEERLLNASIHFMPLFLRSIDAHYGPQQEEKARSIKQSAGYHLNRILRRFKPSENGDFLTYALPLVRERIDQKINPFLPGKTRDQRFEQWARRKDLYGPTVYDKQGALIRISISWACLKVWPSEEEPLAEYGFEPKSICFRTLKLLVAIFDPKTPDDSFFDFAEPYLRAAIRKSKKERSLVVPHAIDDAEKQAFAAALLSSDAQNPSLGLSSINGEGSFVAASFRGEDVSSGESRSPEAESPGDDTKQLSEKEPPDPALLETLAKEERVVTYVRLKVGGSSHIWDYPSAVAALQAAFGNVVKTSVIKDLKDSHDVKKPRNPTIAKITPSLLEGAIATFDPKDDNGDRFRGHLQKHIEDHAFELYKAHS